MVLDKQLCTKCRTSDRYSKCYVFTSGTTATKVRVKVNISLILSLTVCVLYWYILSYVVSKVIDFVYNTCFLYLLFSFCQILFCHIVFKF